MKTRLQTAMALETADWITTQLLKRKESYSGGILFKTINLNDANEYVWRIDDGVYGGNAGILLYLAAAYKSFGGVRLRNAVIRLANGINLYCEKYESQYYGFLTGRLGVAYALFQAAELTELHELRDIGERVLQIHRFQKIPLPKWADFISGKAGMLLGLICLHDFFPDTRLVQKANECANALIKDAEFGNRGLYWDRTQFNRYGLCGVGHGASGVGGPLLEYASWIGNSQFNMLFDGARSYETQFLNRRNQNWADMRMMNSTTDESSETKKQLFSGDLSLFSKAGDMNAWCHGAAGIGMVRLRAYELIKGATNRRELNMALARVVRDLSDSNLEMQSAVLCHGIAGNCELLLSSKYHLYIDTFDDTINAVVNALHLQALRHGRILCGFKRHNLSDNSLFTGLAGVGHFLLRVNDSTIPSILCCHPLNKPAAQTVCLPHIDIATELARKAYPSVFKVMDSVPESTDCNLRIHASNDRFQDLHHVRRSIKSNLACNARHRELTLKAMRLESCRHRLAFEQPFSLLYLRRQIIAERVKHLLSEDLALKSALLTANRDMHIIEETATTWRRFNLEKRRSRRPAKRLVLIPEWFGVAQYDVDDSLLFLLCEFSDATHVDTVLTRIADVYNESSGESDVVEIVHLLLRNIRECLRGQLLVPAECNAMFQTK